MVRRPLPSQVRSVDDIVVNDDGDDSYFLMEHLLCTTVTLFNPHNGPMR